MSQIMVIVNGGGMLSLLEDETLFLPLRTDGQSLYLRGAGGAAMDLPPVGALIGRKGAEPFLQVLSRRWRMDEGRTVAVRGVDVRVLKGCSLPPGDIKCSWTVEGASLAWITLSDKGSRGERVDTAGPLIQEIMEGSFSLSRTQGFVIPDDPVQLRGLLCQLALVEGYDFIMTTGGTGVGPRDITPEATLSLIEKRLPGFERCMTAISLAKTPHAMISRAVAGTLGTSIILNMPGSPKAVRETLEAVLPALKHCSEKLKGDPSDCASV